MVEGLAAFERRFKAIPIKVRAAAAEALETNAKELVRAQSAVAPFREGFLEGSIDWFWSEGSSTALSVGSARGSAYGSIKVVVKAGGRDAFYAWFQEAGTVNMPANPFFFPVYRALRRRFRSRLTRAINKAIKTA